MYFPGKLLLHVSLTFGEEPLQPTFPTYNVRAIKVLFDQATMY